MSRGHSSCVPAPRLAVDSSPIHGQGLFTVDGISRRMKLGELSGTLVPVSKARQAQQRCEVIMLVELSRRLALDCSQGNDFRHLNHACTANCYLRIHRRTVEIYSRGPIAAGSELTVDYGATQHPGGMRCRCGAPDCRDRL